MKLKIKKLHPDAVIPKYATSGAACFDLTAVDKIYDPANGIIEYRTGLAFEIPEGYVGNIYPRSSVYKTCLSLVNSVGKVDCDYRGEVKAFFRIVNRVPNDYEIGDRICQMEIVPVHQVEFEEVDELTLTERGEGGFGSTGR